MILNQDKSEVTKFAKAFAVLVNKFKVKDGEPTKSTIFEDLKNSNAD